jgi:hypothetical protein
MTQGTVERAFQLARSGKFSTVEQIEKVLRQEHYTYAQEHLSGTLIRKELRAVLRAAETPTE